MLFIFFLVMGSFCFGQEKLKPLIDSVLLKSKQTSMYASEVNWDSLQTQVYKLAEMATNVQDLKPAFEVLLNGLRDHHGRIITASNYSTLAYFTNYKQQRFSDNRERDLKIWKYVNDTLIKFEYQLLSGNVAYLKIVGIAPNVNIEKEAKKIRMAIVELAKKNVEGWIIDLRYNGGGNMNPMMAGVGTLLGDGLVGKLVKTNGDKIFDWQVINGNFIYDGAQAVSLPNKPLFKNAPKVAVLLSRWTVSSGELVAIAFKGRPGTAFFGESTGGYTSNTNWEIISKELILSISSGIYCDRNGTIYRQNIPVDYELPFELVKDKEQDKCILEAKKWLIRK
jgi:carboxyl-terminal processing protease